MTHPAFVAIEAIVKQYPDDVDLQYIFRENPGSMTLGYWKGHFEGEFLKTCWSRTDTILDYGCGMGGLDLQLTLAGYRIFGYDPSAGSIAIARHNAQHLSILCDFYDQFPKRFYDRIWMCHILEHISYDLWPGIFGSLKPVPLLITVPLGHGYDSPGHIHHWAEEADLYVVLQPHVVINWIATDSARSVIRVKCVPRTELFA